MTWCCQTTSHNLNQCWLTSMTPNWTAGPLSYLDICGSPIGFRWDPRNIRLSLDRYICIYIYIYIYIYGTTRPLWLNGLTCSRFANIIIIHKSKKNLRTQVVCGRDAQYFEWMIPKWKLYSLRNMVITSDIVSEIWQNFLFFINLNKKNHILNGCHGNKHHEKNILFKRIWFTIFWKGYNTFFLFFPHNLVANFGVIHPCIKGEIQQGNTFQILLDAFYL